MKRNWFLVLYTILNINFISVSQTNYVTGEVVDVTTNEHLAGVTIVVNELKNTGAATDANGTFRIKIPLGAYSLKASLIGYTPVVKTDVIVNAGRETNLIIKMQATELEMQAVTVKADYFDKSIQANNLSTVVLSAEEVRRSPGAIQDFQRILQSMPGVAFSSDQNNELLVRGGSPNENLIIFDDIEIHSVNHYPNEFNSGGPINMVNVDLIEDIQFSTGGFISKYGEKLSSIVILNSREGRRQAAIAGNANISFAGAGGIFEGGFANGKGSWLFSARKSYLDLIVGAIGLTAIPRYYDGQFKIAYDLSSNHKIHLSGIYGNDYIKIDGETDKTYSEKAGKTDTTGIENVLVKQYQYATGATLKSLWTKNLYSTLTYFTNKYHYDIGVTNDFTKRTYDAAGKITNSDKLTRRLVFGQFSDEGESALKFDMLWMPARYYEFNAGASYKTGSYKSTVNLDSDTARYDLNHDGVFEVPQVVVPGTVVNTDVRLFDHNKQYYFLNNKLKLMDERLLLNLGLRYDYFSYSKVDNFSPRFSLSYFLVPQLTSINLAYGYSYQTHAYPIYGDRYNSGENIHLQNSRAIHYVFGIEQIIDEGLKLNVEIYYKKYDRIPVSEDFIHFTDKTFRSEKNLNVGEQYAYGIDFVLQQKLVKDIYGTLSMSYMKSRFKDPRIGYEGKEYSADYEFPYLFTLIVGKRFANLRDDLNNAPFYVKYPSYILPFSNDMEISLKWRYSSGSPYTHRQYTQYEQHREGGITWSNGTWEAGDNINSARYPAYHRLDLMFNSRFNFDRWNLVVSLSIQNIYNRKNVAGYSYNDDGTFDTVYQYAFLPVLGVEIEF